MSYDIQLYRKEVKEVEIASEDENFFDGEANLLPFTAEQISRLKDRLLKYGYEFDGDRNGYTSYTFKDKSQNVSAMLTKKGLYFNASGEGIFEISMTSSEFTDSGEFAKYDPQNNGWEEI